MFFQSLQKNKYEQVFDYLLQGIPKFCLLMFFKKLSIFVFLVPYTKKEILLFVKVK